MTSLYVVKSSLYLVTSHYVVTSLYVVKSSLFLVNSLYVVTSPASMTYVLVLFILGVIFSLLLCMLFQRHDIIFYICHVLLYWILFCVFKILLSELVLVQSK